MGHRRILWAALALCLPSATAFAHVAPPGFVVAGTIMKTDYDGVTDDLLTAGLGASGLASATAPAFANPTSPTVAELRRRTIWNAYRGLVDMSAGGGYGVIWGPNLNAAYQDTGTAGLVAGREYLALTDDGTGTNFQTVMVQIPANFNTASPCLVSGPSSGSRNVYGAVGTTGEWAFHNGCAVAYTDKGTGNAFDDLTQDTVYDYTGPLGSRTAIGQRTNFAAPMTPDVAYFAATKPHRFAYKQAHSGKNVESRWGSYVLQALQFGLYALNDTLGNGTQRFTSANTIIIAAGVSNGGGAVLQAAEQDGQGLIRGVVADEPNIQPRHNDAFTISYNGTVLTDHSRSMIDYYTLEALYAPCAALAASLTGTSLQSLEPAGTPAGVTARANRCASLKDKGLLASTTLAAQATEALGVINSYGFLTEANILLPYMTYAGAYKQILNTYPSDAGHFRVQDNLCGTSFAATGTNHLPAPLAAATAAAMFAAGNNLPPAGGINLINDRAVEGSILEQAGTSRSTGRQDLNIDGDLCFRALATPNDPPGIRSDLGVNFGRVQEGVEALRASGHLHGLPAIIVQGRDDEVLAPNSTGRAYFGLNHVIEGKHSQLHYIEVTNAQHFDTAITVLSPGGIPALAPLHPYFTRALDAMLAHLRSGAPLPGSQVVHTTPRGTTAFTAANYKTFVPDAATTPASADQITFVGKALTIPQ